VAELATELDHRSAEELDQLASALHTRAVERRVLLTEAEALQAIGEAPDWDRPSTRFPEVGRVRSAARGLVIRRWHPEQIMPALTKVAIEVIGDRSVTVEAVSAGLADGTASREGDTGDR
jgi:hypothetical protein